MLLRRLVLCNRKYTTSPVSKVVVCEKEFQTDKFTNVKPNILDYVNRKIYLQPYHPLNFVTQRIANFFNETFKGRTGNPVFSIFDRLNPVVTTTQNFDSLLVPADHPSRNISDCYYINKDTLLRAHMTAHQSELIQMGMNNFLMFGDVYRRDEIDSTHFPVFHQLDAVKLFTPQELFIQEDDGMLDLIVMEKDKSKQVRTPEKQEVYTLKASKMTEASLKRTLEGMSRALFGEKVQFRWVDAYFPFTHPSWELEILLNNTWTEVLGCGIMENKILNLAGCGNQIGWAFGVGLERLAMILYSVPDIRLFWSKDPGFLLQFEGKTYKDEITFKPFSIYPSCSSDLSFWLPETNYTSNDFYDLVRSVAGDMVESVKLVDEFKNKKGVVSHCYRIVYRHMEKTLTQSEVNEVHDAIGKKAEELLKVQVRW